MELSLTEQREWLEIRERIRQNVGTVWAVFEDLRKVRESRLYRQEFATFDEFVRVDLGYTAKYAHRMIQALETKELIETSGVPAAAQIDNERQLRELNGISGDKIAEVLEVASGLAGDKKISQAHLKAARCKVAPKETQVKSVLEDESGVEVPEHLRRAYSNGALLKQVARKISGIGQELQKLSEMPGGEYISNCKGVEHLSVIGHAVAMAAYGSTCSRCGGDGCDRCGGRGWFSRDAVKRGESK